MSVPPRLVDELTWRGLLYQRTDGIAEALDAGTVSGYVGFDPTAPSLHVGNLVPVMGLTHLQRHGHRPVVLVGGGTGLIGDPSGKASERSLSSPDEVEANARSVREQLSRFLDFGGARAALMRNNADWLTKLGAIEFMRDVGKHFTINYMMQKESVKRRLEGGISYTEFSYMLLQAYDFLELRRRDGVTLQLGGSDQWGNITAGIELIRRVDGAEAHALTLPLVTTAAGTKFGKTEAGAVWLDPKLTSPYRFYQFWINADDRDASRYLRYFTLLPPETIGELEQTLAEQPDQREAQRSLARELTLRVHGHGALHGAEEVSAFYFGGLDPKSLSSEALAQMSVEARTPRVEIARISGLSNDQLDVQKLLVESGSVDSNSAARRLLEQGGVSLNKEKLSSGDRYKNMNDVLLHGEYIIIGKGKREYNAVKVSG